MQAVIVTVCGLLRGIMQLPAQFNRASPLCCRVSFAPACSPCLRSASPFICPCPLPLRLPNSLQLDAVTLHNTALATMEDDPTTGFRKLNFLLANPPFPPETFGNLLLLYVKFGCYDLAADVMAENAHLTFKYLSPELYEFLDATIMVQTSPEEVRTQ